ncbi:MAG: site-specific integrase [Bryobacteraceae bacterium]|jgi:integrase
MPKGERRTSRPYLRGNIWWIQYFVPGEKRPRRESVKTETCPGTDKNDANKLLTKRWSDIDNRQVSAGSATVADLLDLFLTDQMQNKRASYRSVEGFVRIHLKPAFGKVRAAEVTSIMISRFITAKQSAGRSNGSINRYLASLRRAFILGREALPPLITIVPKIPKLDESGDIREGFLEHDEYLRMRAELPAHQRLILVIGYHLGFRLGEILALRWDQIDWTANLIRLEKKQTKGKQARVAPLYGELRSWLEMAASDKDRGLTIVSYNGQPVTEVKTAWDKARDRAKLPGLLRHDLRRTAIRNMVRAGIPEKRAMMISGHKNRNVFDRYDISDERDIQGDGEKLAAYLAGKTKVTTVIDTVEEAPISVERPN